MPDLIDREAAVRAVEARRVQAYEMLEHRRLHPQAGLHQYENDLSLITKESILGEIVRDLRALPAEDRRCATCRYWNELRADSEFGDCWGNTKLPTYRRNHYCAAWHPQEPQP